MQSRELTYCALKLYIILFSEVHCMGKKCSVVQWIKCRPVECTAAHPQLTKSPKEEKNPCMFLSVSVILLASVERFVVSHVRDFLWMFLRNIFNQSTLFALMNFLLESLYNIYFIAVHWIAVQVSAVICSTVHCIVGPSSTLCSGECGIEFREVQSNALQCTVVWSSTLKCCAVQCVAVHCSAVRLCEL